MKFLKSCRIRFALVWGLIVAAGSFILFHARVTIPIALWPPVFYTIPVSAVVPAWVIIAIGAMAWISGLLLYEGKER